MGGPTAVRPWEKVLGGRNKAQRPTTLLLQGCVGQDCNPLPHQCDLKAKKNIFVVCEKVRIKDLIVKFLSKASPKEKGRARRAHRKDWLVAGSGEFLS